MSRIGKMPVEIPAGVNIDIKDNMVAVKGSQGFFDKKNCTGK